MKIQFKTKNDKQVEAAEAWLDNLIEEILYGGAKGGGKSYLGASLIFGDALIYPETHYFIARQEGIDLRKFTIPTINEVFYNWGLKIDDYAKYNGQDSFYTLYNGSKVFLIACKELPSDPMYERFGSMQMTRGWIEEAGEVSERAKSNLWLSIGRWKNDIYNLKKKLLITANPKKGWMKREFVEPYRSNNLGDKKKYIQAFATDNPYLPKDYLETLKNEKDTVTRQRLWEGNWDYDEDQNSLVTYESLSDMFSNTVISDGEKYLIVDVARLGKDYTTFNYWEGLNLYKIQKFNKQDTEKTKQKAKDEASIEKIPYSHILIDGDGIGGAIVDGMPGVMEFNANSSPLPTKNQIRTRQSKIISEFVPKTKYDRLKTQCAYKIAELINEHKVAITVEGYREEIIEDLTALLRQRNIDTDGKHQIVKKEDIKTDLGRSPDLGDPIIYRAWFELKKEATDESPEKQASLEKQTNQFNLNNFNFKNDSNK